MMATRAVMLYLARCRSDLSQEREDTPEDLNDMEAHPVWQTPVDSGSLERTLATMTQANCHVLTS
jgi:hypothetical protein